jgi:hypothetical protein
VGREAVLDEPPEKPIESITRVLMFCERKAALRDFAGYQPGKRRKLSVCDEIAKRIAPRYNFPVDKDGDRHVSQNELVAMLADVLRSIPDEQAFLIVSKLDRHKRSIADMIAGRMSKRVKAAFTMCQVGNRAAMLRVNDPTRKSHADEAKDYQNRIAPFIHGTGGGGPSISIRPT